MYIVLAFLSFLLAVGFLAVAFWFNPAFLFEAIVLTVLTGAFAWKYYLVRKRKTSTKEVQDSSLRALVRPQKRRCPK